MTTYRRDGTGYSQRTDCLKLESPRYSSEAATEVATVVAVLNVPKLAEVLSPPPRPVANREDCAVVAVVWVVPFATNAGVELKLGPLAHL